MTPVNLPERSGAPALLGGVVFGNISVTMLGVLFAEEESDVGKNFEKAWGSNFQKFFKLLTLQVADLYAY